MLWPLEWAVSGCRFLGVNSRGVWGTESYTMKGNRDSEIWEILAFGIWNPGPWNLEYSCRNPESKFHWKKSGIQYLESAIQGVESRSQDCLGLPYMGWLKNQQKPSHDPSRALKNLSMEHE